MVLANRVRNEYLPLLRRGFGVAYDLLEDAAREKSEVFWKLHMMFSGPYEKNRDISGAGDLFLRIRKIICEKEMPVYDRLHRGIRNFRKACPAIVSSTKDRRLRSSLYELEGLARDSEKAVSKIERSLQKSVAFIDNLGKRWLLSPRDPRGIYSWIQYEDEKIDLIKKRLIDDNLLLMKKKNDYDARLRWAEEEEERKNPGQRRKPKISIAGRKGDDFSINISNWFH